MTARPKIFVIGHNKCGTTSLHQLFSLSGLRSIHWRYKKKNIAVVMLNNLAIGRNMLHGFEDIDAFSDINFFTKNILLEWATLYRVLYAEFPDAYYIYNTRPVKNWVRSRQQHNNGVLLNKAKSANDADELEVLLGWEKMFLRHRAEIRVFFDSNPRFLEFNIESDNVSKISNLLSEHYEIDDSKWHQRNKTRVA